MCGISGIVLPPGRRVDTAILAEMMRCLHHRGPDDRGWLSMSGAEVRTGHIGEEAPPGEAILVSRRLAIIDLTEDGWQPMSSADGRYHMVYNGEVYNYVELRAELEELGWAFHSRSDTEVVLAAMATWGPPALSRFVGMFAFAFLDTRDRKLTLVRDFFGIKPLYYASWRGGLAFASEIKALLGLPGLQRQINPQPLYHYLRFGLTDHEDQTLISSVRQLPPAHYAVIDLDRPGQPFRPIRYWSLEPALRTDLSFEEAAAKLRDMFLENIRLHLRSDVPIGAAFSGGIDSSAVVTSMRHLMGAKLDIHCFSYIAEGPEITEESWIDLVGARTGVQVHKVKPTPQELLADLDELIANQDEPFRSTSVYAQSRVFRLARETGIKVTLDGQGADEILGGYSHYAAARLASCIRRGRWGEAISLAQSARHLADTPSMRMLYQAGGFILPTQMHAFARRLVGADLVPKWMNAHWFEDRNVSTAAVPLPRARNVFKGALRASVEKTSLPSLLRYEDRNSMAHSVESRVPFLTPQLVQFCLSLPDSYLIARDGTSKAVFRKAMRGIVPDGVLDRRDKIGFETPERAWMTALQAWVGQTISSQPASAVPALDRVGMRTVWTDVLSGRKSFDSSIWRWVNLIRWAELNEVRFDA